MLTADGTSPWFDRLLLPRGLDGRRAFRAAALFANANLLNLRDGGCVRVHRPQNEWSRPVRRTANVRAECGKASVAGVLDLVARMIGKLHGIRLSNVYTNGRVTQQTLADPSAVYTTAYTLDGAGNITQTDITNPRGYIERLTFNSNHYIVSDVEALNTPQQRTTTTERQAGSNLVTATVDGLNRRTEYTYDGAGHVLTVKRLAGTPDAVTTTFTYEPLFNQVATITDPLSHTWTVGYDTQGKIASVTDPLTHQTVVVVNAAGQVTGVTDALQHTWQWGYGSGDLVSTTDPLNAVSRRFLDGAGRVLSTTDPLGRMTRMVPDKLNRVTTQTDPLGGQIALAYDPNGRVLSLTDPLTHTTSYTYDTSDRAATRTDPLMKTATYGYDLNDNLTQLTDRKGQVAHYQYDALDRVTLATYADASTTAYTYDLGDRLTQVVDSIGGTITRTYDGLDRLTSETTPEGSIGYTYDADGRRATMTVAGQTAVSYGYDDAHRLTSITQGTSVVAFTYDDADRRSTLTLPNGIVTAYGYDDANQLTSLTYTSGLTTLGTQTYGYDAAGHRTTVGGTWARTGLPQAVAGATYDAANRITAWAGQPLSYDANGNLASDGLTSYAWNARNQLASLSGAASGSFAYDAHGRRRTRTTGGATSYLYDGANAAQELVGGSPTANVLTGGVDEVFQRTESAGTSAVLTDALGSTVALVDGAGAVQTQYTYEPFGATTSSGAASTNPAQYTGRENDGTGLYYYRARYYNPTLGRFTSEDPLGFGGGDVNVQAYVSDRPTVLRDPSGLDVTIWLYQGLFGNPFGQVALSINDGMPIGFGPEPGGIVPPPFWQSGIVEPVPASRQPSDRLTIPTTPEQDAAIWDYMLGRARNPGWYTMAGRNCTRFVEDALGAGHVTVPWTVFPGGLIPGVLRLGR